jgi:hypothetical protein
VQETEQRIINLLNAGPYISSNHVPRDGLLTFPQNPSNFLKPLSDDFKYKKKIQEVIRLMNLDRLRGAPKISMNAAHSCDQALQSVGMTCQVAKDQFCTINDLLP